MARVSDTAYDRHSSSVAEGEIERGVFATLHETKPRGVYINLSIATTMERMGDYTVVRFADGTNFEVLEEPLHLIRNIIKQP